MSDLLVPARFCGPPSSGNGGWTAGALAALVPSDRCPEDRSSPWPAIEVTLLMPPPLDTPLPVRVEDGEAAAALGEAVVARARLAETDPSPTEAVDADTARAAQQHYPGLVSHPFATCVVCGSAREPGDGMRIFPGPVSPTDDGRTRVAATWTPHPSVSEDYHAYGDSTRHASLAATWGAIDCIGGWAGDLTSRLMVLGRMTARVDALPVVGEPHVVVGEARGGQGRKTLTAATLYDADGRQVATAEHLWIAVDPADFA